MITSSSVVIVYSQKLASKSETKNVNIEGSIFLSLLINKKY